MLSAAAIAPIGGLFAIAISLLVVACVFFLAYSVMWALKRKLGPQLAARVTGQAESAAGSLAASTMLEGAPGRSRSRAGLRSRPRRS